MLCPLEFHCVSNRLLRNHIKNIAFITFLYDIITFQKNIYGMKISYMQANFKCNAPQ
jgi:hypothetical protein